MVIATSEKCLECDVATDIFNELEISIRLDDTATEILGAGCCRNCVLRAVRGALGVDDLPAVRERPD